MDHNPYYDESLGQTHFATDQALQQAQFHALQVQEDARQHQIAMGGVQNDFSRLQGVSQQVAPQQHHGGVPWGGLALGALAGYALANRQQDDLPVRQAQGSASRPVLPTLLVLALVLHLVTWFIVGAFISSDSWGLAFVVIGLVFWPAAVFFGLMDRKLSRSR